MSQQPATISYYETSTDGALRPPLDDVQVAEIESAFPVGEEIGGRYVLQTSLGRGGMGQVFLARDSRLGRLVAIKVVAKKPQVTTRDAQDALAKEARLGAILNHPGIATVFDFGVHAGRFYTVFEYIEGLTLRDVLNRRRQVPLTEASQIVTSLAQSLDYAHSNGIVHRDLKPENVCIDKSGQLKLLDLGTARDLRNDFDASSFSGTPAYAAPEQAACGPTDGRTDQYALGVMSYEMLAGRRPFVSDNPQTLLIMHQNEQPSPIESHIPDISPQLRSAIMRSLEKDPQRRFGTCQEFANVLLTEAPADTERRTAVDIHAEQRYDVYICFSSSDSLTAKHVAQSLERLGFSIWRDFVGLNVIRHRRRPLPEDSFQFVCRHTLGRPRDFVAIASELSANKSALNERKFCDLVRQTSAVGLVSNIFDEMRVFLDCLADKATRLRFLADLPANILSREEVIAVNAKFNGLSVGLVHQFGEESDEIYHPFRDLYMIGLLGVVVRDADTDRTIQKFKQLDDLLSDVIPDLPNASFYLIHPALSTFIAQQRTANDYYMFRHVVVGENSDWLPYNSIVLNLERHTAAIQRDDLRDAVHQVLKQAQGVLSSGTPKNLRLVVDSMTDWQNIERQLQNDNHDEVVLWMEELLSDQLGVGR